MRKSLFFLLCCCIMLLTSCQKNDNMTIVPGFDIVMSEKNYKINDDFFSGIDIIRPMGIAFTTNHIVIADQGYHALLLFTLDGKYEQTIGSIGKGHAQFFYPTALDWKNNKLWNL